MPTPTSALPAGLHHPYDAVLTARGTPRSIRPRATTYRHGHTFTWQRGDAYVAVQRGRCANANQVVIQVHDPYPGVPILVGRQPVTTWWPAPDAPEWHHADVMRHVADAWIASQRARMRVAS